MTGRSGGLAAATGARSRIGVEAVRHTDEIFEALATGGPVSPEDTTVRLLRSLVADVSVGTQVMRTGDTPAGRTAGDAAVARTEAVSRFPGASSEGSAGRSGQPRITESRGPLRCR